MRGVYHESMRLRLLRSAVLVFAPALYAQPQAIFPLSEVRAGQRATARTVFSGNKVEEFQVEILGILENLGPKQNIILGKLSGGPLEKTGVMQGMSGSPVYLNGRLMGAVALAFPFAKEAIAGIRPIEEMLTVDASPSVERLGASGMAQSYAPGKWALNTVVCHLADCELAFGYRWRQVVAQPHHLIQPFDQDAWAAQYSVLDAKTALASFLATRHWNLSWLK